MQLNTEILAITTDSDGMTRVKFSCYDGEDTGMVSFVSEIDLAHACFLSGHVLRIDDQTAYAQMIHHIAGDGSLPLFVGQVFTSSDEDE